MTDGPYRMPAGSAPAVDLDELPKPTIQLYGLDGNAFNILGHCVKAAKRHGWTEEQIKFWLHEATSQDYKHLLATVGRCFEIDNDDEY